ncbi:MAG: hypothetical protein IJX10_00110 [Phascolarctobacterium sp.]|nr:hypothetical protein [Phascolarctobacterium sp.]
MIDSKIKKTCITLFVISSLLCNAIPFGFIHSVEAKENTIVTEYDPFSDDDEIKIQKTKENQKLTFKERLAKIKSEEQKASQLLTIDNVLPGHIYIPKKTILKVELVEGANSKTHKKNQEVEIRLTENLIINGVLIIPKGTIGTAYVYKSRKAGGFGRKGILQIAGKEFKTINNITVPLKKGLSGKGKTDGGAVAVAAAVSLVGGLFMKGSNIDYPAGTNFEVEVRENVDLMATQENLSEVMNPKIHHGLEIRVAPR